MLTIVYNGSLITYYRNGKKCDSDKTEIKKIYDSPQELSFGGGNGIYFKGAIDDIKIYSSALDGSQVRRLYDESQYGGSLGISIPAIYYHKIVDNNTDESDEIILENFEKQMKFLHDNGFKTITTEHYANWKKGIGEMEKKSVIIFFDDGWKSVYEKAFPIMSKYEFIGTVPAVIRYANGDAGKGYMNWTELNELQKKGWRIEAHSLSHEDFLKKSEFQIREDMEKSKAEIIKNLVKTPESFVFPFHRSNAAATLICGEYYELCWTAGDSVLSPNYNYFSTNGRQYNALRRISIQNNTTLDMFKKVFGRNIRVAGEWHLDEYGAEIAKDYSGNNNDGKLINGAYFVRSSDSLPCFTIGKKVETLENTPVYETAESIFSDRDSYLLLRAGATGAIVDGKEINGEQIWHVVLDKDSNKGEEYYKSDLKEGGWITGIYLATINSNCDSAGVSNFENSGSVIRLGKTRVNNDKIYLN